MLRTPQACLKFRNHPWVKKILDRLLESDAEDEGAAPWKTLPALYRDAARARGVTLDSIEALVCANTRRFIGETS